MAIIRLCQNGLWFAAVLALACVATSCGEQMAGRYYRSLDYGLPGRVKEHVDVKVYYLTTRAATAGGGWPYYEKDPGAAAAAGSVVVRVGRESPVGGLSPFLEPVARERAAYDGRIASSPATFRAVEDLFAAIDAEQPLTKPLLIYVHGFNVDYPAAVTTAAKLACDLGGEVAPVVFSWPSAGEVGQYVADENNAHVSGHELGRLLLGPLQEGAAVMRIGKMTRVGEGDGPQAGRLNGAGGTNRIGMSGRPVHLIAHSMGSRVALYAMEGLGAEPFLKTLNIAAADVDAMEFRALVDSVVAKRLAGRTTIYIGEHDAALEASRRLHGRNVLKPGRGRAGQAGTLTALVPGCDTVDVTLADLSPTFHSYVATNRAVLGDLYLSLILDVPAEKRNLYQAKTEKGDVFWLIRP